MIKWIFKEVSWICFSFYRLMWVLKSVITSLKSNYLLFQHLNEKVFYNSRNIEYNILLWRISQWYVMIIILTSFDSKIHFIQLLVFNYLYFTIVHMNTKKLKKSQLSGFFNFQQPMSCHAIKIRYKLLGARKNDNILLFFYKIPSNLSIFEASALKSSSNRDFYSINRIDWFHLTKAPIKQSFSS